jgi:Protein of unknown function (DUF2905)
LRLKAERFGVGERVAMRQMLMIGGIVLLLAGLVWPWLSRLPLGGLPGDLQIQRPGFRFFAPLGSSLVISAVLSLVLTLIAWLWRR